ncbi:hypothetical protein SLS56_012093 [Neofusicoccum ribis]|uniref:Uncharacterized protein n=1 Tax=Neofusicoccum ribis TaxID=45134 RepID=A0ABR3S9U7_9PEZI
MRHWVQPDTVVPTNNALTQVPDYLPNASLRLEANASMIHPRRPLLNNQVFEPLRLLSEVAAVVLPSRDPRAQTDEYKNHVMQLKKEVESAAIANSLDPSLPQARRVAAAKAEIYRLSTLTYLNRATGDNLMQPSEVSTLVDRGFEILGLMRVCERSFPLLILGCEARTDSERLLIMELISETEMAHASRGLDCIRTFLHAIWTQDDLHAEQDLKVDYFEKLAFVISSSEVMPSFA